MATSRRSRSIIAMLVRTDAYGEEIRVPGGESVVAAFSNRDVDALRSVLKEHPGAWNTEMPWYSSQRAPRRAQYCTTVKMAVALNWAAGLDVLLAHGADPDARYDLTDLTSLDIAVRLARPALVKRLLAVGAKFKDNTPAATIRMMFAKEYAIARLERCWKVMDTLAATIPLWTVGPRVRRGHADVLVGLLDCHTHPDGGSGQALRLLEKFPVPIEARLAVAASMSTHLGRATQLWERADAKQATKLFDAMAAQEILPSPEVFVSTAIQQWGHPESDSSDVQAWIREMLLIRMARCPPDAARSIMDQHGAHPCLTGALGAHLSGLAMQNTTRTPSSPSTRVRF